MSLRTRLTLALGGSGLAILLGGLAAREIAMRYASEASIQTSIESRLSTLDRETCESGMDIMRREFRPRPGGGGFGGGVISIGGIGAFGGINTCQNAGGCRNAEGNLVPRGAEVTWGGSGVNVHRR